MASRIGTQAVLTSWHGALVRWFCVIIIGYHLYAAQFGAPEVMYFRPTHVSMYLCLIFLIYRVDGGTGNGRVPWYDYALALAAWAPTLYIAFEYERISWRYAYITPLTPLDWTMGILVMVLAVEACRRAIGLTLVGLFAIFLVHALFGDWFPDAIAQTAISPQRLVDHLYLTTSGIYSSITGISATYVLMFVLMGAMLEKARGGELFMNTAIGLMGRQAGGPGKAAVVASGLFGSISGAAVANVYATGTFTIPLMIRTGFKPRFAAAVEAVASSSGQLVPPIMGSAAFLIADFTRTPYIDIAWAATLPALLYLFAVYMMVHLETAKYGLPSMPLEMVSRARRDILRDLHMALALVMVVAMLVQHRTPFFAAYIGVVTTIVVAQFRSHTRLGPRAIVDGFELGARRIAPIAAALFVAGMIVGTIELTGLGLRFTSIVLQLTGGNLFLTLLLVMLSCIVLGMGLPTAAAYMIVAIFGAPALIQLGVQPLAAHFFVFYYAIISAITPPVAVAAYAAATIANTPMQATGWSAMKLGAAVYIVPFVMVYSPSLLLVGEWWQILQALVTAGVGVVALAIAVQGFCLTRVSVVERLLAGGSALLLLVGGWRTDLLGTAALALLLTVQLLKRPRTAIPVKVPSGTD